MNKDVHFTSNGNFAQHTFSTIAKSLRIEKSHENVVEAYEEKGNLYCECSSVLQNVFFSLAAEIRIRTFAGLLLKINPILFFL